MVNKVFDQNPKLAVVSYDDLVEAIREAIADAWKEAQQGKDESETYLTAKEVKNLLGVSAQTLWRWQRKNYLCHVYFGGSPRWKKSDIEELMQRKGGKK